MLISDDCLSFLKMQIDHYRENNQCLSDAGREKYAPLKSVSALSWDETNQESVVSSNSVQLNFDAYAQAYTFFHHEMTPSSCDALSQSKEKKNIFVFTEFKNGNIIGRDPRNGSYFVARKDASAIDKKLADSADMLLNDGVANSAVIKECFIVLIVVRNRDDRRRDAGRTFNPYPVLESLEVTISNLKLHQGEMRSAAESHYRNVIVVSDEVYRTVWLPRLRDLSDME